MVRQMKKKQQIQKSEITSMENDVKCLTDQIQDVKERESETQCVYVFVVREKSMCVRVREIQRESCTID